MAEQRNQTPAGDNTQWTTVIRPRTGWFDVDLEELWRYRDLIVMFVKRNFTVMYKQTILGPLWIILNPLITTVLFNVVFGGIAGLSTDGTPSFLFYMAGNTVWTFFASCINGTANTFVANSQVFGKVYFPRLIVPLVKVLVALATLVLNVMMFIGFWLYYRFFTDAALPSPALALWLLPVLLHAAALGLGMGLLCASTMIKYKDMMFFMPFFAQLWMYATPIIYPASQVPAGWRCVILYNPMSWAVEATRWALVGKGTFGSDQMIVGGAIALAILGLGLMVFNRVQRTFIDII